MSGLPTYFSFFSPDKFGLGSRCYQFTSRRVWQQLSIAIALVPGLTLAGCHYKQVYPAVRQHRVFFNDFEQLAGWLPAPAPTLTTERAHSGRYSVRVDAEHPFSITYRLKVGEHFSMRPRRMRLSAWVWMESSRDDAQLVFTMGVPGNTDPQDKSKLYVPIYLLDNWPTWPFKRWTQVNRDVDLPPELSSKAEIAIYLWYGGASHPVFTDDWELTELH